MASKDTTKNNNKIEEKKKDEEEKKDEEKVPDYGGTATLKKKFSSQSPCDFFMGFLCCLLNGSVFPIWGLLFRDVLEIMGHPDKTDLRKDTYWLILQFVLIGFGAFAVSTGQYFFFGRYATALCCEVRQAYFSALLRQEVGYHDIKNSGKLNAKLVSDPAIIENGTGEKFGFFLQSVFTGLVGFGLAFYFSYEMTLVLLACLPVLLIVGAIQGIIFMRIGGADADPFNKPSSLAYEILSNIKVVTSKPSLVKSKITTYEKLLQEAFPIVKKKAKVVGLGIGFMMFGLFGVQYSIGLWYGSTLVKDGTLKLSDMFGCYFSFLTGGMAFGQIGSVAGNLKNAQIAANSVLHLLQRTPEIKAAEKGKLKKLEKKKLEGKIEFKDVKFSYPTDKKKTVLKGISFSMKPGENLALVGPSGSGKSTVISLLERYYDPDSGDIIVDGELIHNYDMRELRSNIGYVGQMPLLFDTTIMANIRAGNTSLTDDDIVKAAKSADADEFINNFPKGYQTVVGEMGGRLSGGQRQRICIARAIASNPSILILDEATSSLDTKSEREVQKALDNIAKSGKQTMVTIAHRLSTIKNADQIIVIVNGNIEERGNHTELMDKDGLYSLLVKQQTLISHH